MKYEVQLLCSKWQVITADGDCSCEIRRELDSWKKSYDKARQCIKNKGITFPTKVHIVKAMVFPVVMYGC